MLLSREKMVRAAERALKRTEIYQELQADQCDENYQLDFILATNKGVAHGDVIAFASLENEYISFRPFGNEKNKMVLALNRWDFDYDSVLFHDLENGWELVAMSIYGHYGVWHTMEEWKDVIEHKAGMKKYMDYCKRIGISAERLEKGFESDGMDLFVLKQKKTKDKDISKRHSTHTER